MKLPPDGLRYNSWRDAELSKIDGDKLFYGFWFFVFAAVTFALLRWWFVAAIQS